MNNTLKGDGERVHKTFVIKKKKEKDYRKVRRKCLCMERKHVPTNGPDQRCVRAHFGRAKIYKIFRTHFSDFSMVDVRNISSWSRDNAQYISRWVFDPCARDITFLASPAKIQKKILTKCSSGKVANVLDCKQCNGYSSNRILRYKRKRIVHGAQYTPHKSINRTPEQ